MTCVGLLLQGSGLDAAAQARAEAKFYQGIPPAETHQLLAMLLPCCPTAQHTAQQPRQQQGQAGGMQGSSALVDPSLVQEAAAACSRPLAQQLQHLASLAETVFESPVMHISPCITPLARLQLLPGSVGTVGSPVMSPTRPPSTPAGAAAAAAAMVAVGPPLLQPKPALDLHTYLACLIQAQDGAAGGVGTVGQQQLLLARLRTGSSSGAQLGAEAVILQLPLGLSAGAWAFYKDQQLALLLHDPTTCKSPSVVSPTRFGASTPSSSGSSSLYLVELSEAPWAAVQQSQQGLSAASNSALEQCVAACAVVDMQELPRRSRVLQHGRAGQLAVSRARGLGSLVTDMQHLLLLDLEEDEGAGEDEGSEGDEEDMQQD